MEFYISTVPQKPEKGSYPLRLKVIVNHLVQMLGTTLGSSNRTASALNC